MTSTTSTNYLNTLIEIADDCLATAGEVPPLKPGPKTVATLQFEMLQGRPYAFTSDEVLFAVFAGRNAIPDDDLEEERALFFSKGQPCFRASPLPKRYGWGVHSDEAGRIAIYGVESAEYQRLVADPSVTKTKAMRSRKGRG